MENKLETILNNPLFSKQSQDELRYLPVKTEEEFRQVNSHLNTFKKYSNTLDAYINSRVKSIQEYLTLKIKNGCNIDSWDGRKLQVLLNQDQISVRFIFDIDREEIGKYSQLETQLEIATKYRVYGHDGKILPKMEELGIAIADVCGIRFPSLGINLCKGDNKNETEAIKIYNYLGKEFHKRDGLESDGLMAKIKEFYIELNALWEFVSELHTTMYRFSDYIHKYELALNVEKAREMNLIKYGSVIMVFKEKTEYVEFTAFNIHYVGSKRVLYKCSFGTIDYKYFQSENDEGIRDYRYFLKIKNDSKDRESNKEELINSFGSFLNNNSRIEIYSLSDWKDFIMLNKTENENILGKNFTPDIKKISNNYGRLKNLFGL
jgi:hypothetical protein